MLFSRLISKAQPQHHCKLFLLREVVIPWCPTLRHNQDVNSCRPFGPFRAYYYADTDALSIFLIKTVPGLIEETDTAVPGMHVDYSKDNKIVRFDILRASKRLRCHFWEALCDIGGRPASALSRTYDVSSDTVTIEFLLDSLPSKMTATDDEASSLILHFCTCCCIVC